MRAILSLVLAVACGACAHSASRAPAEPAPTPAAVPAPLPAPAPESLRTWTPITICVYQDGKLTDVEVTYDPATGDTLIGGRKYSEVYPSTTPPYAAGAEWFVRGEPVVVGTGRYSSKARYGLPRVLGMNEIQQVGEWRGVPMFAEAGITGEPAVVYLLVRTGCEFQPYQAEYTIGDVRG